MSKLTKSVLFGFQGPSTLKHIKGNTQAKNLINDLRETEEGWKQPDVKLRKQFLKLNLSQRLKFNDAPLAQLVEQLTLNQWVPGSNP